MTSKTVNAKLLLAATGVLFATGCATDPHTGQPSIKETFASDDPCSNNARNIGIGAGAVLGAIVGNQFKHSGNARVLGAVIGATAGGLIGHDMDERRCALAKIAKQYNLDIKQASVGADGEVLDAGAMAAGGRSGAARQAAVGAVVQISELSGGHFESNGDRLTPRAQQYFSAIADAYNDRIRADGIGDPKARADYIAAIAKRKILLVGHTDDSGSSKLNADLSERRAKAVGDYMAARGIARESLYYQGAGEVYPVAGNDTEEGRAANRRVEIVEIADQAGFDHYLAARKPHYDYYRPSAPAAAALAASSGKAERVADNGPAQPRPRQAAQRAAAPSGRSKAPTPAVRAASARPAAAAAAIDFGGVPLIQSRALADVGPVAAKHSYFSLISSAYAAEPPVTGDCTLDRPRVSGGVKALADGKNYRTSEHVPGLYGKTWTDQVNGHQIVINKVAVLANDGSLANLPEFKVYPNYDPRKNANPAPAVHLTPQVNAYLGSRGVLYRMFLQGSAGLQCADIVFSNEGGPLAKAGKLVYARGEVPFAAEFKPKMYK
jgi:outer membrane protein OmpA-like peptidoglycan-associated protein